MVLVFYCYVTNYHTHSSFKKHTHLLCPSFHGSGNWACCSGSYKATINVLAGLCSFLELGIPFLAHMIVGRFQFIVVVGLTQVPTFFLALNQRLLSSFEGAPSLPCVPVTTRQLQGQQKTRSSSRLRGSLI